MALFNYLQFYLLFYEIFNTEIRMKIRFSLFGTIFFLINYHFLLIKVSNPEDIQVLIITPRKT